MMKLMQAGCAAALVSASFVLVISLFANSAYAFEIKSDRGIALGNAALLTNPTAADVLSTPGLQFAGYKTLVSFGLQRRYNLSELDNSTVSCISRMGAFTIGIGLQQLGRVDYFAERTARLILSYQHQNYSVAGIYSVREFSFGSAKYSSLSASAVGVSLGFKNEQVIATLTAENINAPQFETQSDEVDRSLELQFQPRNVSAISASFRILAREHQRPQLALGQSLTLSDSFRLLWGLENRPLQYGAGFEIALAKVTIIYGGRFHPELGYTQQASLAFGIGR